MSYKWKFLIIVTAIVLIPVLTGMTPVNFVHKIGAGCPFSQGKQVLTCNPCPFHSLISQDDPIVINLSLATSLDQESTSAVDVQALNSDSIHSNITFNSVPLRC